MHLISVGAEGRRPRPARVAPWQVASAHGAGLAVTVASGVQFLPLASPLGACMGDRRIRELERSAREGGQPELEALARAYQRAGDQAALCGIGWHEFPQSSIHSPGIWRTVRCPHCRGRVRRIGPLESWESALRVDSIWEFQANWLGASEAAGIAAEHTRRVAGALRDLAPTLRALADPIPRQGVSTRV